MVGVGLIGRFGMVVGVMTVARSFVCDGATAANLNAVRTHPTLRLDTTHPTLRLDTTHPTLRLDIKGLPEGSTWEDRIWRSRQKARQNVVIEDGTFTTE